MRNANIREFPQGRFWVNAMLVLATAVCSGEATGAGVESWMTYWPATALSHGRDHRAPFLRHYAAVLNPNPAAPLAAIVTLTTDEPTTALLTVTDAFRTWHVPGEALATTHSINVLGLRPNTSATIRAELWDAAGRRTASPDMSVTTAPLPSDFPPIRVVSDPAKMVRGVTFFGVGRWQPLFREQNYGLVVAVDAEGEVVWYYKTDAHAADDVQRLRNGNLLIVDISQFAGQAIEIDMLGNIVRRWHPRGRPAPSADSIRVDTDTMHHDMVELPNGNFLTLSSEMRVIADFPTLTPAAPTETAKVVGDLIVEFEPNGTVVRQWSLFDMVDVHRIGYLSNLRYWDFLYGAADGGTRAWTWANGAFYNKKDDSIVVSMRHQNAVMKFSRRTGEIAWILSDPTGWGAAFQRYLLTPEAGTTYPYAQHAPMISRRGTLLLHDNGNFRAMPPNPITPAAVNFSRAVEYQIDEKAMSVRQLWAFGGNQYYSTIIGDVDTLNKNHLLVTFGGQAKTPAGIPTDNNVSPGTQMSAQILEIDQTDSAVVFELTIRDPAVRYTIYRSERMRTLSPERPPGDDR